MLRKRSARSSGEPPNSTNATSRKNRSMTSIAVAALGALAPRFEKGSVVVIVRSVLEFAWRAVFHGQFHAALALVGIPDGVIESELHLLLDVARESYRA